MQRDPGQPMIWVDPLPSFVNILVDHDRADPEPSE